MPGLTINRPVPVQKVESSGKYLKSDGVNATWEDVTAGGFSSRVSVSRTWDTSYQNTSGKVMLVEFNLIVASNDNGSRVNILTDANNPPTTVIYQINNQPYGVSSLSLIVFPNNYYQLTRTGSHVISTITSVFEVT